MNSAMTSPFKATLSRWRSLRRRLLPTAWGQAASIGVVTLLTGCSALTQLPPETAAETGCPTQLNHGSVSGVQNQPGAGGGAAPEAAVLTYAVAPQLTDSAIDNWLEDHYVAVAPSVPARDLLLLFFSGTNGQPSRQQQLIRHGASLGAHAINLRYPNTRSVGRLCRRSPDPDCHEKVRQEILDGRDRAEQVQITPANAIENRLIKLLKYLHTQNPDQGWLTYLKGETIDWSALIVAGHSQGGGQAALIGKRFAVSRVILFAAPADYSRILQAPAPWLGTAGATLPTQYYGFVHTQDPGAARIQQAWQQLGMGDTPAPVDVDTQPSPYDCAQRLLTSASPEVPGKFHGSVVTDRTTPQQRAGLPLYHDVWEYLLFGEG